ncbi:MAG: LysE family transporter [Pseudomonadota bacterium]
MSMSIAFILFAAAITPGPNNLVVMDAARRGLRATIAPITGIVLGTLALILALRFGLDVVLLAHPRVEDFLRVAAAFVLGYLAVRTVLAGWRKPPEDPNKIQAQKTLFFAMFSFQIINPKTWVLAGAVSTTHAAQPGAPLLPLLELAILVPVGCLSLWGAAGRLLGGVFQNPLMQKSLSLVFALIFALFAIALVLKE